MHVDRPLRVMFVAGEPSGDVLAAGLLTELRALSPRKIDAFGVGGPELAAAGLDSLFPMADLSVMGVSEVVPRLPMIQAHIAETSGLALGERPDVLITVDSPDFTFRVAAQVRRHNPGIPIVHFVGPQVWAWRRGRARKISRFVDHLLALLPFEPEIFNAAGLPTTFVGHPVVERTAPPEAGAQFRERYAIDAQTPLLAVLPGSRNSEVSRLLPDFGEAVALLLPEFPDLHVFCATVGPVAARVRAEAAKWAVPVTVTEAADEKAAGFAACDAAIAASGTVSLELAATGTPHLIGYRFNPVSAFIARRVLQVPYVNLVNLILDEPVIPELLAEGCTPEALAMHAADLLRANSPAAEAQRSAMARALAQLSVSGQSPNICAAKTVLAVIEASSV